MRVFILTLFFNCEPQALLRRMPDVLAARGWRVDTAAAENGLIACSEADAGECFQIEVLAQQANGSGLKIAHRFGVDPDVINGRTRVELTLAQDSDQGDPVDRLRSMAGLALALLDGSAVAVWWGGVQSLMAPELFSRSVAIWLDGGAFPALGLTALRRTDDGIIRSVGLSLLAGQEIAAHPGIAAPDSADQARLAIRVIDFLVREGPLMQSQAIEVEGFGSVRFEIDQNKGDINLYC